MYALLLIICCKISYVSSICTREGCMLRCTTFHAEEEQDRFQMTSDNFCLILLERSNLYLSLDGIHSKIRVFKSFLNGTYMEDIIINKDGLTTSEKWTTTRITTRMPSTVTIANNTSESSSTLPATQMIPTESTRDITVAIMWPHLVLAYVLGCITTALLGLGVMKYHRSRQNNSSDPHAIELQTVSPAPTPAWKLSCELPPPPGYICHSHVVGGSFYLDFY